MKTQILRLLLSLLFVSLAIQAAHAHEVRPAYLEITETEVGNYGILWKLPVKAGIPLGLVPSWPDGCAVQQNKPADIVPGAMISKLTMTCDGGLAEKTIRMEGLSTSLLDVFVRIEWANDKSTSGLMRPAEPYLTVQAADEHSVPAVLSYLILGIEHILFGYDHLAFVLGLLLIVQGFVPLVKTITSFTIAHSITLALAALGLLTLPSAPVEAVIALSILFLGYEAIRLQNGQSGLTSEYPWSVAFTFGLLHGLGFAGALSEIGLPDDALALALLLFNIGVEVGQLLFVGAVVLLYTIVRQVVNDTPAWSIRAPAYLVGTMGAYWLIDRTWQIFVG